MKVQNVFFSPSEIKYGTRFNFLEVYSQSTNYNLKQIVYMLRFEFTLSKFMKLEKRKTCNCVHSLKFFVSGVRCLARITFNCKLPAFYNYVTMCTIHYMLPSYFTRLAQRQQQQERKNYNFSYRLIIYNVKKNYFFFRRNFYITIIIMKKYL